MIKLIASIFLIIFPLIGYSQDISVNSGLFKSQVYGIGDFPSEFNAKSGYGVHLSLEYNKILYSTHSNLIYGLEWKHYQHDMSLLLKDDLDKTYEFRNGTYKTDAVSFLYGMRTYLNSNPKVQYQIDALFFLSWNYNSKFSGEAYKWFNTEIIDETTEITYESESSVRGYFPLSLGIILRPGIGIFINETNYLSIQGLLNANVFGSLMYSYEVIDISMWNYGINVGWTFEIGKSEK